MSNFVRGFCDAVNTCIAYVAVYFYFICNPIVPFVIFCGAIWEVVEVLISAGFEFGYFIALYTQSLGTMSFTASVGFTAFERWYLFHMVCIPLRLLLAAMVYTFRDNGAVRGLAIIGGLGAFLFNCVRVCGARSDRPVWWHRPVHMLSAVGIVLASIASKNTTVPSVILLADAAYGLVTFHLR